MRLVLTSCLLLWASPAQAGIAYTGQTAINSLNATTSLTVTITAPQAGNALVLYSAVANAATITSVTGGGVTWLNGTNVVANSGNTEIWYGLNSSGSGTSITITYSASDNVEARVAEFSGIMTSNALDVKGCCLGGAASPANMPSLTTTNSDDLLLAVYGGPGGAVFGTSTNSFTDFTSVTGATNSVLGASYAIATSVGTYTSSRPETGTLGWADGAIALKAAPAWNYATLATSLAPPALDPWSGKVVSGSNDGKLYAMNEADGTQAFAPYDPGTLQPIQSRPAILPASYRTQGTAPKNIAYFTSQAGFVYAVDTSTGLQVWKSPFLPPTAGTGKLQGGVGVWIQALYRLKICGVDTVDVVFVGTRDGTTTTVNRFYALNGSDSDTVTTTAGGNCIAGSIGPGGIMWNYVGASGTNQNADIITSTPYVDQTSNAVLFTSHSNGGAQPSVWRFNAADGILRNWSAVNDVDSSPVPSLSADGNYVYVGTNAGTLRAYKSGSFGVNTYTPSGGTGPVAGMPWNLSYRPVGSGAAIAAVSNQSRNSGGNGTSCGPVLPAAPQSGNTMVVVVAIQGTASSVTSVSDGKATYIRRAAINNGTNVRVEIWTATAATAASPTVTVTVSPGASTRCAATEYSGAGIGGTVTATGSGTNPSISLQTQDNNNWVVAGFATASASVPTVVTGTTRQFSAQATVGEGQADNTSASPASVTVSENVSPGAAWAAAAVELRTTTSDRIIFTQGSYVQSVSYNGTTFTPTAAWGAGTGRVQLTGTPTLSAPVDDGNGHLYIGGSDGKVHQVDLATGADQQQVAIAAFDKGFNFRATTAYVTDGANETYVIGDAYPTSRNGVSFGWETNTQTTRDRAAGNDRRLAGVTQQTNTGGVANQAIFRVDLPAPGTYQIHLALGDAGFAQRYQYLQVQDNTTPRVTITVPTVLAINNFYDATGTNRTTNWPTTEAVTTQTFTSTILRVVIGSPTAQLDSSTVAHLRIYQAAPTLGDPTFNWDTNQIHVGASDGRIYTLTVPF